jgi:glycosyltransferase involved in cell wall biosynthesis
MLKNKNNFQNTRVLALMNAYTDGRSGGDVAFIQIFKSLDIQDLSVVTSFLGEKLCRELGLKAEFKISTSEKKFGNIFLIYFFRILRATFYIFKTKPELIYSSSDSLPDILPPFLFKIFNRDAKWIVKRYHDIPRIRFISSFAQKISLLLIKSSDLMIQNGKFGFDQKMIKNFPAAEIKYDAVFMARIHDSKGVFDLVEIWRRVVMINSNARLAIIGGGNKYIIDKLREKIGLNMRDNIFLLGFLPSSTAFGFLKSAKLFLFPSREEAFGLVLGEAMLCKTPIVSYALPALSWCRNYIFSVPCFEKKYFVKLIVKLLSDEKKRMKHVEEAKKFAESFTWEKAAEWEKVMIRSAL